MASVSPSVGLRSISLFSKEELEAMISTAHARGVKVAAHANTPKAMNLLMDLGVDTIEHGGEMYDAETGDRGLLRKVAKAGSPGGTGRESGGGGGLTWVPTLAAYYTSSLDGSKFGKRRWERCKTTFEQAIKMGNAARRDGSVAPSSATSHSSRSPAVSLEKGKGKDDKCEDKDKNDLEFLWNEEPMENIACGGDTGVFSHGKNALELILMRQLGASWERVLGWATLGGWKCVRGMEWEGEEGIIRVRSREKGVMASFGGSSGAFGMDGLRLSERSEGEDDQEDEEEEEEVGLDRDVPFGVIRGGWAADLVAVKGKLDGSPAEFEWALTEGMSFVMKSGIIYKMDGIEVLG
ncbi:hypothetical protein D9613_004362 [Agrocybe pediades]|uniref:Amidohydrolase-related domain-containing protein n=1 Tax=Agrocybe pediades TaxID=84607 RepID=A0A8H4QJH0_9AGAR|nr:hypothetical protein D9613_004362 [Agrocybe pediades]